MDDDSESVVLESHGQGPDRRPNCWLVIAFYVGTPAAGVLIATAVGLSGTAWLLTAIGLTVVLVAIWLVASLWLTHRRYQRWAESKGLPPFRRPL